MVGESRKMKISISITENDFMFLRKLVEDGFSDSVSQAVRHCIKIAKDKEGGTEQ